jgi:hypothetical protein
LKYFLRKSLFPGKEAEMIRPDAGPGDALQPNGYYVLNENRGATSRPGRAHTDDAKADFSF